MRNIIIYIVFILFITILLPLFLVKGCSVDKETPIKDSPQKVAQNKELVKIYNTKTKNTDEMELEEYLKGVLAAEMPAAFHIEALKAQAIAARTYALNRIQRYGQGHPEHITAPLCTGVHCQAYLTLAELKDKHGESWIIEYWPRIVSAVEDTKHMVLTYDGELIEAAYHSTSGGMTEDSENVFATARPYLRSVQSPYEEGAPKLKDSISMPFNDFVKKLNEKYPNTKITKKNITQMIKVADKSDTGRIMKLMIGDKIVEGREFRALFNLNSTNFKVNLIGDTIQIETLGNGHGVGMSQWGANGMAKNGSSHEEILKHYYQGVEIRKYN
ncbi:stage II sporulation protein D [Proteiniborus ethanoligenes]|uniref:Stage II sporulation protein D n=1 Tax=Proteiniborus ethanoligenes TaxID=415015 RepID=A0A1H3LSZ4_9FIRM|nr:stage II sporulation protein D [Proteiniborus ethanoligenes]SDY66975.1 stage II sporulation protein D [Proteiniborus ethanoligenes]